MQILKDIKRLFLKNSIILNILWLWATMWFFSLILKMYIIVFILSWLKLLCIKNNEIVWINTFSGSCCYRIIFMLNQQKNVFFYLEIFCVYAVIFILGCSLKSIQISLKYLNCLKFNTLIGSKKSHIRNFKEFIEKEFILEINENSQWFLNKRIFFKVSHI